MGPPNARHLGRPFQWKNALPWHLGRQSSESSASKIVGRSGSGTTIAFKTTFEFTWASPDNSLERLTERSVGFVTDRPSDVYELFITLFK